MRPSFSMSSLSPCTTRSPRFTCASELKPPPALAHGFESNLILHPFHLLLHQPHLRSPRPRPARPEGDGPGAVRHSTGANGRVFHFATAQGLVAFQVTKNPAGAFRVSRGSAGSRWDLCSDAYRVTAPSKPASPRKLPSAPHKMRPSTIAAFAGIALSSACSCAVIIPGSLTSLDSTRNLCGRPVNYACSSATSSLITMTRFTAC